MDDPEEKTALQKFLYPEDEELPENFEVRACIGMVCMSAERAWLRSRLA
jgi:hypothetical protein